MQHPAIGSRYQIHATLGRGASSTVFKARDLAIDRDVVLKTIHVDTPGGPSLARVQREARLYGALEHPLIVSLYDVFPAEPDFVLVLQYIEGADLRRILELRAPPIRLAVQVAADVAEALVYLHGRGVIHRDLKPSNLIVRAVESDIARIGDDNRTVIADLGIGKRIEGESDQVTEVGSLIGTAAYMSPEQLKGQRVSFPSDIYAIGTVLYEMVAGRRPFLADTLPETLHRVISEPLPDVAAFRSACPSALSGLLEELLSKDPEARPTAERTLNNLQTILKRTDWTAVVRLDATSVAVADSVVRLSAPAEILRTQFVDKPAAPVSAFFATDSARFEEFTRSVEFYRSHLDDDYNNLLHQAKVAFWLWLVCVTVAFLVLAAGIGFVFVGSLAAGSVTIASDGVILFLQSVFKQREDHYRSLAEEKHRHLKFGDLWNLAVQSADGLGNAEARTRKLGELLDALIDMLRATGLPLPAPAPAPTPAAKTTHG